MNDNCQHDFLFQHKDIALRQIIWRCCKCGMLKAVDPDQPGGVVHAPPYHQQDAIDYTNLHWENTKLRERLAELEGKDKETTP